MPDVATIDRHLKFLRSEMDHLRKRSEPWARRKVEEMQSIVDTLLGARRELQMMGIGGKRIDAV